MNRRLHCECGYEARATDEDGLVREVQRHALEAHGMTLAHDEALLLTFRAELDENPPLATPHPTTRPTLQEEI